MGWIFSANQSPAGGRTELVDYASWCPLPLRMRSPGDEDGAHQGIVSLKCFLKMYLGAFRGAFSSV